MSKSRRTRIPFRSAIAIALACLSFSTPAFGQLQKTTDNPDWAIRIFDQVVHKEHPGFARWFCKLGDINRDGFGDFAVATAYDTTFIFLGGDPLHHEPYDTLYGGGPGIATADFNHDGLLDLVTALDFINDVEDPAHRGLLRIYIQKSTIPYFGPEPEYLLQGDSLQLLGSTSYHPVNNDYRAAIQVLDYNGDQKDDLLVLRRNWDTVGFRFEPVIFLGDPPFSDEPDIVINLVKYGNSTNIPIDVLVGDFNGDGFDDVMFAGEARNPDKLIIWELYLGNAEGRADAPDRILDGDDGWSPSPTLPSAVFDVNNDGYDDIVDSNGHRIYGDALVFHGQQDLPQVFEPTDSIPNFDPRDQHILGPKVVYPVGDMDGNGMKDLLIGWNTYYYNKGTLYHMYPMHPWGLDKVPKGYQGTTPEADHVLARAYDAGDVNGDGYDDFATIGGGYETGTRLDHRFQINLGSPMLATGIPSQSTAIPLTATVYPNPLATGSENLHVRITSKIGESISLYAFDVLGRLVHAEQLTSDATETLVALTAAQWQPGVYHLVIATSLGSMYRSFTVL
ncbi:T9SS type A sorting domain-containing protein [bacterium]|nr:T9SS type A sorting domain-containing protein [bacterium]